MYMYCLDIILGSNMGHVYIGVLLSTVIDMHNLMCVYVCTSINNFSICSTSKNMCEFNEFL